MEKGAVWRRQLILGRARVVESAPEFFPKASGVGYLIFAAAMAAITIGLIYFRSRPNDDPMKSVDSFRRAMHALGPQTRGKKRKSS